MVLELDLIHVTLSAVLLPLRVAEGVYLLLRRCDHDEVKAAGDQAHLDADIDGLGRQREATADA